MWTKNRRRYDRGMSRRRTRALGIELLLAVPEALPLGRDVRPVRLGGAPDFFKGDLLFGEQAPEPAIVDVDIARRKRAPYAMQRQIGSHSRERPIPLVFET